MKIRLAQWTREGIDEIVESWDDFMSRINWKLLVCGTILTLAIALGAWLPWLTD